MKYEIVFESEHIYYVKVNKNLINDYLNMINDKDVQKFISKKEYTITYDSELEWVNKKLDNKEIIFSMIEKETGKFIGNIGIEDINNNIGELGISITRDMQDKHYGTESIKALIEYAYNVLKLEGMELNVYSTNPRAIHCYENVGFIKDGIGKEPDDIHMSLKK